MTSGPSLSDTAAEGGARPTERLDFRTAFVILSSLILFTIFWYFGRRAFFLEHLVGVFPSSELEPLYPFFFFCFASVFYRMLIPMLLIRVVLKRRLRDTGYRLRGTGNKAWVYGLLFVAMIPLVIFASTTQPFQNFYPQFRQVIINGQVKWEHVLAFELIYGLLFLSGESFWRGYMVFGLEPKLGYYGILVMVVPYVMSHYEKPFMETMGAIVAGSVLGYLALKHRNFWLGVLVHWGVAMLMDFMALYQLGVEII